MVISISIGDGLCVTIEVEGAYSPDVLDDMTSRARDMFRLAMADAAHLHADHDKPAE